MTVGLISGCGPLARPAPPVAAGADAERLEPDLSGDGRLLVTVVRQGDQQRLLLQALPDGQTLPLGRLERLAPHHSPSLSWNGRYLAVIAQQGASRVPLVLDRLTGRLHRLPLPAGAEAGSLSLAPDGQRLAIGLIEGGQPRLRLLSLSGLLEPDLAPGQTLIDPGGP